MTAIPPENYAQTLADDTRAALPPIAGERELLVAYLDHYRETFELKCRDLNAAQLSERAVAPSALSLHGLARHLAGTERWWFQQQFRSADVPHLYYTDDAPDLDFEGLEGDPGEALAVWRAECATSRRIVAEAASLDETGVQLSSGQPISLRRIVLHMITEYARHDGHADLLRERLDGATGR
ncbi:DinB family protein [Pseudonocardia sp. GCM10023141]|uniref:DinB family protein n=1 Tax=Pseudonocardia sp. GCM10023141 TaxID=3252653 RepID=UPI00360DFD15